MRQPEKKPVDLEPAFIDQFTLTPLDRAVTNTTLRLFRGTRGAEQVLVKVFGPQNATDAERELAQYQQLQALPFVPKLLHNVDSNHGRILAYEWIDGQNVYDFYRSAQPLPPAVESDISLRIFQAALDMGNHLYPTYFQELQQHGTRFSLQNPLYRNVVSPEVELEFDTKYQEILEILELICQYFPGIFSDRNPGNVLITPEHRMYQVDFGILEATSPVFDAVRILRTKTAEPSIQDLDGAHLPSEGDQLADPPSNLESDILEHMYSLAQNTSRYRWQGSLDLFKRAFYYAALNEHIFYLSKAVSLLNKGQGNRLVQTLRQQYHRQMLPRTYQTLIELDEPIDYLKTTIDNIVQVSQ